MKYTFVILIGILLSWHTAGAQDIRPIDSVVLEKEHLVGRWVEKTRFMNMQDTIIPKHPYTYIFKEDGIFHRGATTEDVLIFNVAGRYGVEGDTVTISYRDYTSQRPGRNKGRTMIFKIIAWSEEQMTAIVSEPYDREYTVILVKPAF